MTNLVEKRNLTWILLISARLPISAVRFVKYCSQDATLPPLANPPITDTPQENLGGTPSANLLTRCGWVGIDTPSNSVDLSEELLVEQWRELLESVLNMLNDLGRQLGDFERTARENTHLLVDLLRCHTLFGQVVKNVIDLDGVSLEAFVDVRGLDQVSEIRKPVQVLRTE